MPKQFWMPVVLFAEICFSLLSSAARAEGPIEHTYRFWPKHDVNFSIVTDQSNRTTLSIHGLGSEKLAQGTARLIPNIPKDAVSAIGAHALPTTKVKLDHDMQVVMINQTPYVLFEEGRAVQLPRVPGHLVPEVRSAPKGLAIGYLKDDGGYQITILEGRRVYTFEDPHASSIDEVINKIDFQELTYNRGFQNKVVLDEWRVDQYQVHAISEKRTFWFKTDLKNWPKRSREAFLNSVAHPSFPATASFGKPGPKVAASQKSNISSSHGSGGKGGKAPVAPKQNQLTGVELLEQENAEKDRIYATLNSVVKGQKYALERIAYQISSFKKGDGSTPKVVIFAGNSGGGKTFAAHLTADEVHPGAVFPIFGNEYSAHSGSLEHNRLLVSHKKNGALTEFAIAHPDGFSVVIDEGDKMHVDVWLKLMEFLRTGQLTDFEGKPVTVRNLFVIITTNRGALRMFPATMLRQDEAFLEKRARSFTQEELRNHHTVKENNEDAGVLPVEVLNRVSEIIAFIPTTENAAVEIARDLSKELNELFESKYKLRFNYKENVIETVAKEAWARGSNGHAVNRQVKDIFSDLLDRAPQELGVKNNDVIDIEVVPKAHGAPELRASANGKSFLQPLATTSNAHPAYDPEKRKLYRGMEARMNELVVGQRDVISAIASGFASRAGKKTGKPFFGVLFGPSGIGKSEISRSLGLILYGSADHVRVISMGEISDDAKFDAAFGVAGQMQNGNEERQFEKILREFPEGCVINFAEISNMGGGNPASKGALAMRLYTLVEEGVYVSPRDGRRFDLTKYQFLADGNDLERAFLGVTDDDMLMEKYRQINHPEKITEELVKAGFPIAFLNRADLVAIVKPLLRSEVLEVSSKIWLSETAEIRESFRDVDFEPSPELLAQLSRTFFSAEKGGRSVRALLKNRVLGLLNTALMHEQLDSLDFTDLKLNVSMIDTASTKTYDVSKKPRKITFSVQLERKGEILDTLTIDVTKDAPKRLSISAKDAVSTSAHEIGHTEGNDLDLTKEKFRYVTIRSGSIGPLKYLGFASADRIPGSDGSNMTREELIGHLRTLYSGRIAQELLGFPPDRGWGNDLKHMRQLVSDHLVKFGLDDRFIGLPLSKDGEPIVDSALAIPYRQEISRLMELARLQATEHLTQNWPLIRSLTAELVQKGHITAERRDEIKAAYARGELASNRNPKKPTPWVDPTAPRTCRAFGANWK